MKRITSLMLVALSAILIAVNCFAEDKSPYEKRKELRKQLEELKVNLKLETANFAEALKAFKLPDNINCINALPSGTNTKINLDLKNVSIVEALSQLCSQVDAGFTITDVGLIICPKDRLKEIMETIVISCNCPSIGYDTKPSGIISVVEKLQKEGIDFPEGSDAVYLPEIESVIALNTPDRLDQIEEIISKWDIEEKAQVAIETKLIEIDTKKLEEIRNNSAKSAENINQQIICSEYAKTIASAAVLVQDGQGATIKLVSQVYLPESWYKGAIKKEENEEEEETEEQDFLQRGYFSMPEFSEPTELGISFTVAPTIDPDRCNIKLDLNFIIQSLKKSEEFASPTKLQGKYDMPCLDLVKPVFSCVTARDGSSILLSEDTVQTDKEMKSKILFATVRIIEPEGNPYRTVNGEAQSLTHQIANNVKMRFTKNAQEFLKSLQAAYEPEKLETIKVYITNDLFNKIVPNNLDRQKIFENFGNDFKNYFKDRCIVFRNDSIVALDKSYSNKISSNLVTITNTPFENRKLEWLLSEIDIQEPQVEIEYQIVKIETKNLKELNEGKELLGLPDSELAEKILASNMIERRTSQRVLAVNGHESANEKFEQRYLPSSWSSPILTYTGNEFAVIPPEPEFGEATELGTTLSVTPTIASSNHLIDMNVNSNRLDFAGWTDYFCEASITQNNKVEISKFPLPMPELNRSQLSTTLKICNGKKLCVGKIERNFDPKQGLSCEASEKFVELYFISARLINPEGKPIIKGKHEEVK